MSRCVRPLALGTLLALIGAPACSGSKPPANDDSTSATDTTHTGDDSTGPDDSLPESTADDSSSPSGTCGWNEDGDPPGYYCGGSGAEPTGTFPMACPVGLVEGDDCTSIGGEGCCDDNGNNWYCGQEGDRTFVVFEACG